MSLLRPGRLRPASPKHTAAQLKAYVKNPGSWSQCMRESESGLSKNQLSRPVIFLFTQARPGQLDGGSCKPRIRNCEFYV
ncbi:hypothetical protein SBV1_270066 [Verrucomicrobia bacterium]|nr:hypothetical protein SBV1_270066 [Verrucomicrobiota bacterium]